MVDIEEFQLIKKTHHFDSLHLMKLLYLCREELGKLTGVQKAQISRLENNTSNVTIETLLRVFTALKAKIKLQVELPNFNVSIG